MSTTEKLPKWASLLLGLLIGGMITFGGQLFIARATPLINQPTSCQLVPNNSNGAKTTFSVSSTLKGKKEFTGLVDLIDKQGPFQLKCS